MLTRHHFPVLGGCHTAQLTKGGGEVRQIAVAEVRRNTANRLISFHKEFFCQFNLLKDNAAEYRHAHLLPEKPVQVIRREVNMVAYALPGDVVLKIVFKKCQCIADIGVLLTGGGQ